jgi:hypothetical protein
MDHDSVKVATFDKLNEAIVRATTLLLAVGTY